MERRNSYVCALFANHCAAPPTPPPHPPPLAARPPGPGLPLLNAVYPVLEAVVRRRFLAAVRQPCFDHLDQVKIID